MIQKVRVTSGPKGTPINLLHSPPKAWSIQPLRREYPAFRAPDRLWTAHTYRNVSVWSVVSCSVRNTAVVCHVLGAGKNLFFLLPSSCLSTFWNVSCRSVSSLVPSWNSKTFSLLWLHVVVCPKLICSSLWVTGREIFLLVCYKASRHTRRLSLR
jgi:hypothetical protein